jgi:hypothetical protein
MMRALHGTIHRSVYVQARGVLILPNATRERGFGRAASRRRRRASTFRATGRARLNPDS